MSNERKVIVITGGGGDLGGATSQRLAQDAAQVILLDIMDEAQGKARAAEVGAVAYYPCDQTDRAAIDRTLAEVVARFGRLDATIANAAMVRSQLFQDISTESWQQHVDVNLTGCFHVAQSAVRLMLAQPLDSQGVRGKILFTSSWVAQFPLPKAIPYVVTKGAIDALVRAMAQELAHNGIRVNAIAPGLVYAGLTRKLCEQIPGLRESMETMVPLGEMGTSEQVAEGYAFLCSDASNYMTGQTLTIDGGCSVINRPVPADAEGE